MSRSSGWCSLLGPEVPDITCARCAADGKRIGEDRDIQSRIADRKSLVGLILVLQLIKWIFIEPNTNQRRLPDQQGAA